MSGRVMHNQGDIFNKTFYHRAIQTHIGRALRARYDLSQPLPNELALLVTRIDARGGGADESRSEISASEPNTQPPGRGHPLRS